MTSIFLEACPFATLNINITTRNRSETTAAVIVSLRGLFVTLSPRITRAYITTNQQSTAIGIRVALLASRAETWHLTLSLRLLCESGRLCDANLRAALLQLRQVQTFYISMAVDSDDAALEQLRGLDLLQELDLSCCDSLTNIDAVSTMKSLRNLIMKANHRAHNLWLESIKDLTTLETLDVSSSRGISSDGLQYLRGSQETLTSLDVSYCVITDEGLEHIACLHQLRQFACRGTGITDAGVKLIAESLCMLEDLDISVCKNVTDASLAHVAQMDSLLTLDLSHCQGITDLGFKFFTTSASSLPKLRALRLVRCDNVNDESLRYISALSETLENLNVSEILNLSHVGVKHLADRKMTQLTLLNVSHCRNLDSAALKDFVTKESFPKLQSFVVRGCNTSSEHAAAAIEELRKQLVDVDVKC